MEMYDNHYFTLHKTCPCKIGTQSVQKTFAIFKESKNITTFANEMEKQRVIGKRICEAGMQNLVFPIRGEAHALPYASSFFDAVVCINSLQFYGTADTYLIDFMAHLIRTDGQFGLVVWGPDKEFNGKVPGELEEKWWPDFYYFHSLDWWRWHFEKTKLFTVGIGDDLDGDGVRVTRQWAKNNGKVR
jgi:SAM-dependent methyltransferase